MEQAKAPKQLSGSITAIVFGAFLRGPPIILVHILGPNYTRLAKGMPGGRRGILRHGREEACRVLVDRRERVGSEEARRLGGDRIRRRFIALRRGVGAERIARI